ncbi:EamA family transporter RarD [Herbidospora mongoliensis]|uniref:EamA family transporter RarD n=1 Tax=Herbidospora mongoliensis TaxID=688067 RepID=UPI00082EAE18|nr:EamA family transporter RarD [Herbidospora mongoliensis]
MPDLRRGVWYGIAAYALWGLFPLYWPLLKPSGAIEILAHRMLWSLAVVVVILAVTRNWSWIRQISKRQLLLLAGAGVLVSTNWGVYIYAVNTGHVVESALGYFINPLVSILFGVIILGERLRRWQWVAVGLGAAAVVILTLGYGKLPWIALTLAFSFGLYGLVKKKAQVGAAESLTIETLVMLIPAGIYLTTLGSANTFGNHGTGHAVLLISSGVVTAIPLLFFAASVITVPLTIVGLLQYIAPVLQFLVGVLIIKETMPAERWLGFGVVWLALAVFTWDSIRHGLAKKPVPEKELAPVG